MAPGASKYEGGKVRPDFFQEGQGGVGAKAAGVAGEEGRKGVTNNPGCPAEAQKSDFILKAVGSHGKILSRRVI